MSGSMRSLAQTHLQRAITRWPRDPLRPTLQLQDVLTKRLEMPPAVETWGHLDEKAQLKQVNAMLSLLENRYQEKYRILGRLMQPQSNPTYYHDLLVELEEAPKRGWFERLKKRLSGMIRFS